MIRLRVRQLMEERWWSVVDLAQAAGISYGTAFYLYRGKMKRIDLGTLDRLCAHFGVEPGDLLEYAANDPPPLPVGKVGQTEEGKTIHQDIGKVLLEGYRCRCGHEWRSRDKDEEPRVCPKCKSPNWNRPRKFIRKFWSS